MPSKFNFEVERLIIYNVQFSKTNFMCSIRIHSFQQMDPLEYINFIQIDLDG